VEHEARGFLFVGNRLCLDFINTEPQERGRPIDLLQTFGDLLRWLVAVGVLDREAALAALGRWGGEEGDTLLIQARRLRTALRDSIDQFTAEKQLPEEAVGVLNEVLGSRFGAVQLVGTGADWRKELLVQAPEVGHLIVPVAEDAADLICSGDVRLVRRCGNPGCVLYFYDSTKNRARRWCSMEVCGNRMKAAGHRERRRDKSGSLSPSSSHAPSVTPQ